MKRSAPIKRSTKPLKRTPVNKKRSKPRRGQDTPEEVKMVRAAVIERSAGRCELNMHENCIRGVLPESGATPWDHGHLVHMRGKGADGKTNVENCRWGCHFCHLISLHNPKPCPPKIKPDQESD